MAWLFQSLGVGNGHGDRGLAERSVASGVACVCFNKDEQRLHQPDVRPPSQWFHHLYKDLLLSFKKGG